MKRIFSLILLFALFGGLLYATNNNTMNIKHYDYKSSVKKIDKMMNTRPSDALVIAREMFENGSADKNYKYMVKAMKYIAECEGNINWNSINRVVKEFEGYRELFKNPDGSPNTQGEYSYLVLMLQITRDESYIEELLNMKEQLLKHKNLYQEALMTIFEMIKYDESSHYQRVSQEMKECGSEEMIFTAKYNDITLYYERMPRKQIRLLKELISDYQDNPLVLQPIERCCNLMISQINLWPEKGADIAKSEAQVKEVLKICREALDKFPKKTKGRQYLKEIEDRLLTPHAYFVGQSYRYPDSNAIFTLKHINCNEVKVIVRREPNILKPTEVKKCPIVAKYTFDNLVNPIGVGTSKEIALNFSKPGRYYVMVDPMTRHGIYTQTIDVTNVAVAMRNRKGNEVYLADLKTGEPIKDASIVYVERTIGDNSYYWRERERLMQSFDGFTKLKECKKKSNVDEFFVSVVVDGQKDEFSGLRTPFQWKERKVVNSAEVGAALMTDRALYRPEDTLFFKGIIFNKKDKRSMAAEGATLTVELRDPSWVVLDSVEVVSNDFGSFSGRFTIPSGSMNGGYSLRIKNLFYASKSVRVESYKKPTYLVNFKDNDSVWFYGDTVKMSGDVQSYAGFPISEAQVAYTISKNNYSREVVAEGEVKTDKNGLFSIDFVAARPDDIDDGVDDASSFYVAEITISDSQGETYKRRATFRAGDKPFRLVSTFARDEKIIREYAPSRVIKVQSIEGGQLDVSGKFVIDRLLSKNGDRERVCEGLFQSSKALEIDYSKLSSGQYKITYMVEYRGAKVEDSSEFVLVGISDTTLPIEVPYLFIPLKEEIHRVQGDSIRFMVGTCKETLYLELEIMDGSDILLRRAMKINRGMEVVSLPYLADYPDKVGLSLVSCIDNDCHFEENYYARSVSESTYSLKINTLRDVTVPNSLEKISFEIFSSERRPSEILLSVFNKSTDRLGDNRFGFNPVRSTQRYIPRVHFREQSNNDRSILVSYAKRSKAMMTDAVVEECLENAPIPYSLAQNDEVVVGAGSIIKDSEEDIPIRSNFSETLAFLPHIVTMSEDDSRAEASFTTSELLSTFRILALSHTKNMDVATAESEITVQKEVMIMSSFPLFIREGDTITLQAKVVNMLDSEVSGSVSLSVPSLWPEPVLQNITLAPKEQRGVEWVFTAPSHVSIQEFVLQIDTPNHKDGERHFIPILSSQVPLVESDIVVMAQKGQYSLSPDKLLTSLSKDKKSLRPEKVTVEVSNPLSSAFAALPSIAEPKSSDMISWVLALYANNVGSYMLEKYPLLRQSLEQRVADYRSLGAVVADIEKNTAITNILLSETPWANLPETETKKMEMLAKMLDSEYVADIRTKAMDKISAAQNSDGGFGWFPGMYSSIYVTSLYLEKMSQLRTLGAINLNNVEMEMTRKTLKYYDYWVGNYYDNYRKKMRKEKISFLDEAIICLYVRSMYDDVDVDGKAADAYKYFYKLIKQEWGEGTIMQRAMIAQLLLAKGETKIVKEIANSLDQYAVENNTVGLYYPNAVMPFRGMMSSELKAHSMLLNLYNSLGDAQKVKGLQQWILLQKKNQSWNNNINTANAIYALLSTGVQMPDYSINIKGFKIDPVTNRYEIPFKNLSRLRDVKIESHNDGLLLGALYFHYSASMSEVEATGTGFTVERGFYKKRVQNGEIVMDKLSEGDSLSVGEEIVAEYKVVGDENRSFVHLKAMRAACFMPVKEYSGFEWNGAVGCYREVKESATNFYFQNFPEGSLTFRENFFVTQSGAFSAGLVEIQSLYAPEYRAKSSESRVESR